MRSLILMALVLAGSNAEALRVKQGNNAKVRTSIAFTTIIYAPHNMGGAGYANYHIFYDSKRKATLAYLNGTIVRTPKLYYMEPGCVGAAFVHSSAVFFKGQFVAYADIAVRPVGEHAFHTYQSHKAEDGTCTDIESTAWLYQADLTTFYKDTPMTIQLPIELTH